MKECVTLNQRDVIWLRLSGICGIITPIVIFTFILLAIAYSPQFSWTENALSDLGIQEGATAILFNSGLMIGGILALIFASGIFIFLKDRLLGRIGALLFALDALALVAIGVFPESVKPMHYQASVAFFVLLPISMSVICATFLLMDKVKIGLFTLLAAMIAVVVWILQFTTHFAHGVAIPEAISAISALMWSVVLGFMMLRQASHSNK